MAIIKQIKDKYSNPQHRNGNILNILRALFAVTERQECGYVNISLRM